MLPSINTFLIQEAIRKGQCITISMDTLYCALALECRGPFLLTVAQKYFLRLSFIHSFLLTFIQQMCIDLQLRSMFCVAE